MRPRVIAFTFGICLVVISSGCSSSAAQPSATADTVDTNNKTPAPLITSPQRQTTTSSRPVSNSDQGVQSPNIITNQYLVSQLQGCKFLDSSLYAQVQGDVSRMTIDLFTQGISTLNSDLQILRSDEMELDKNPSPEDPGCGWIGSGLSDAGISMLSNDFAGFPQSTEASLILTDLQVMAQEIAKDQSTEQWRQGRITSLMQCLIGGGTLNDCELSSTG